MAAASGLTLVPPAGRRPLRASSFGTGELIRAALDRGVRQILLGIGGSASTDAGAGMAQALGIRLLDARGRTLSPGIGGGDLHRVARIDRAGLDPRLASLELLVACDVNNPLVGPRGAAAVYGPQKGATPAHVKLLDHNLRHFGRLAGAFCGQPLLRRPGAGAAGGLGAGLLAFAGARLVPGGPTVLAWAGLEHALSEADLVVTGEGRLDGQTRFGKTPASVAALAARYGVPVIGLAGSLSDDANVNFKHGFAALSASVARPMTDAEAMRDAARHLSRAAERLGHSLVLGQRLRQF
jgi:glycerate kinase